MPDNMSKADKIFSLIGWIIILLFVGFGAAGGIAFIIMRITEAI